MKSLTALLTIVTALAVLPGCPKKVEPAKADFGQPLPEGDIALRRALPEEIPDFTTAATNLKGLEQAILQSLKYLQAPSSQRYFPYHDSKNDVYITHEMTVASLEAFLELIRTRGDDPAAINQAIRERFDVYISIGGQENGDYNSKVRFTGYYTPILDASLTPQGKYTYPLYKAGPEARLNAKEQKVFMENIPRRRIEGANMLAGKGLEIVYLPDPFQAYVVQVQGSALLRLVDQGGQRRTLGYSATNGMEYISIRGKLIEVDKKIPADQVNLGTMMQYFNDNPQDVRKYTWENPRFTFFDWINGGPRGCLGVPVTSCRTIATDKDIFPRAGLALVDTPLPTFDGGAPVPYQGFVLDQDTGGGIRLAGRCDFYFGIGDKAGQVAGGTLTTGRLFYIYLKPDHAPPAAPEQ